MSIVGTGGAGIFLGTCHPDEDVKSEALEQFAWRQVHALMTQVVLYTWAVAEGWPGVESIRWAVILFAIVSG